MNKSSLEKDAESRSIVSIIERFKYFLQILIVDRSFSKIVLAISVISSSIFAVMTVLTWGGIINIGTINDYVVASILSGTSIYGFYQYLYSRRIWKIDSRFPDFVRDLAESRKAGMTFTKAIMVAANGNYGLLTPEIRKMVNQISWGASVIDALSSFAKRVNTPLINRTVSLINEASKSGGSIADILAAASSDAREINYLQSERKSNMASYVIVVYVSAMVFLTIVLVLVRNFLPMLSGQGMAGLAGAMGRASNSSSSGQFIVLFFYAAIIQSFGSGIVAGVFENGRFETGIKHAFILTFIAWIAFKFIIGGI